jgi:hypothetical protein
VDALGWSRWSSFVSGAIVGVRGMHRRWSGGRPWWWRWCSFVPLRCASYNNGRVVSFVRMRRTLVLGILYVGSVLQLAVMYGLDCIRARFKLSPFLIRKCMTRSKKNYHSNAKSKSRLIECPIIIPVQMNVQWKSRRKIQKFLHD